MPRHRVRYSMLVGVRAPAAVRSEERHHIQQLGSEQPHHAAGVWA